MPTEYAMGFLFDSQGQRVALIRKNRPALIAGKLTGLGGHREEGESFAQCIVREYFEESGVATQLADWTHFATVSTDYMLMSCFFSRSALVDEVLTLEDEEVCVYRIEDLAESDMANFTAELIRLALHYDGEVAELN